MAFDTHSTQETAADVAQAAAPAAIFDGANYWRLRKIVSTEETRYYVNGVLVTPHRKGVLLVATDGHRLGMIYDETGRADAPIIVKLSGDVLKMCKPAARKGDTRIEITTKTKDGRPIARARRGYEEALSVDCVIDGQYPDFWRVVPNMKPADSYQVASFNPLYLGDFAECSVNPKSPEIRVYATDATAPAIVKTDLDCFLGVLMPRRGADSGPARPIWFRKNTYELRAAHKRPLAWLAMRERALNSEECGAAS